MERTTPPDSLKEAETASRIALHKKGEHDGKEEGGRVRPDVSGSFVLRKLPARSLRRDRIMSLPPEFLRRIAARAAAHEGTVSSQKPVGGAAVKVYLNDPAESTALARDSLVAEGGEILAFKHLHLVLATAARRPREHNAAQGVTSFDARSLPAKSIHQDENGDCVRISDTTITNRVESAGLTERPEDPVIRHLFDALALAVAERAQHCYSGIHVDALRLAVAIRLLGLQSDGLLERSDDQVTAELPIRGLQKWRLKRVAEYVDAHLSEKVTLRNLAAVAGLSRMRFASQFRAATGLRPHEYLLRQRIRRADELLRHSTMAIVEVALTVGFLTQAHFTTVFKRFVGYTPRQWRRLNLTADRPGR
jgi:AraC-like DNA-binding protein